MRRRRTGALTVAAAVLPVLLAGCSTAGRAGPGPAATGRIDVRAGQLSAGDQVKVDRLYVAERDSDRLLAVQTPPDHEGLSSRGHGRPRSPVRDVGTDETRVYAATDDALVVFEAASFTGYPDGQLHRIATIPYRDALSTGRPDRPVPGLAVGPDRVG